MSDVDDIQRVGSDDILYHLRREARDLAENIRLWQRSACAGSIRDDDHIHRLVSEAGAEIIRLRLKLKEAGIDPTPPSAVS